jgi:hypothetical protein
LYRDTVEVNNQCGGWLITYRATMTQSAPSGSGNRESSENVCEVIENV